jgi:hypothetical protein
MIDKIKFIYCKIVGHSLQYAGECPFTGVRYDYCDRCHFMLPLDHVDID